MDTISRQYDDNTFPDWTIEEFDAIQEEHVFSGNYQKKKKNAIKSWRRKGSPEFHFYKTAAAIAACIALPVCVYAAVTHADFFRNAFGNAGRQSTAAHEEIIEDGKGGQISVTYPERDYISIDEEAAESLIGDKISSEPIVVDINDHTLTILSAVRDENAIVMEFTLDCETGVTALRYDDLSNEAKGAGMSDQATFHFRIDGAAEKIYVDKAKSTETSLHCYYYGLFVFGDSLKNGESPVLTISYADKPWTTLTETDPIQEKSVTIPAENALKANTFTSESDGLLELSPVSLEIDMSKGLGLTKEEAYDPVHLEKISIQYQDGSDYQVYDRDSAIDNTAYLCGGAGPDQTEILLAFNRLVDPSKIKAVTVNDTVFTLNGR